MDQLKVAFWPPFPVEILAVSSELLYANHENINICAAHMYVSLCLSVCVCTHALVHTDQRPPFMSLLCPPTIYIPEIVKLGGKCPYSLSHLTSPYQSFYALTCLFNS